MAYKPADSIAVVENLRLSAVGSNLTDAGRKAVLAQAAAMEKRLLAKAK